MKKKTSSSKSIKKYKTGGPFNGGKTKEKSPGGAYVTKKTYDDQGNLVRQVERRTTKGFFMGAPKAKGVTYQAYKKGGVVGKSKKK